MYTDNNFYQEDNMTKREKFNKYILPWLVLVLIVVGVNIILDNLADLLWVLSTPLVELMR